jgi:hypothetical protein
VTPSSAEGGELNGCPTDRGERAMVRTPGYLGVIWLVALVLSGASLGAVLDPALPGWSWPAAVFGCVRLIWPHRDGLIWPHPVPLGDLSRV